MVSDSLRDVEIQSLRDAESQCASACNPNADQKCVTECQVKMFFCLDNDPETYDTCMENTLKSFKQFPPVQPNATQRPYVKTTRSHFLAFGKHLLSTHVELVEDQCTAACGKTEDKTCVPECQMSMYTCLSHDDETSKGAKDLKSCKDGVMAIYQAFSSHAGENRVTSADMEEIELGCERTCRPSGDPDCRAECQVKVYSCFRLDRDSIEGNANFKTCVKDQTEVQGMLTDPSRANNPYLAGLKRDVATADMDTITEGCSIACAKGDINCALECEVQMAACFDIDRTTDEGVSKHTSCMWKQLDRYAALIRKWDAAHPQLMKHGDSNILASDLDNIYEGCSVACSKEVDSSCVPECHAQMYQCFAFDKSKKDEVAKHKTCVTKQLKTYTRFAKEWMGTHPRLSKHSSRHIKASDILTTYEKCNEVCSSSTDSTCGPTCQVEMYDCFGSGSELMKREADKSTTFEDCVKKTSDSYKNFEAAWNVAHPEFFGEKGKRHFNVHRARDRCTSACGISVDSTCVVECQVQWSECVKRDHENVALYKKHTNCEEEVIHKYEQFADDWEATHPYLLSIESQANLKILEKIRSGCRAFCVDAPAESICAPECGVNMYQ